ncbi:ABC transporter ATP-binding protein [bacterium]|nr:ABC transporter ATP-binding protein [bacterium]
MSALANDGGLRASHLCFSYGERQIIDNISLELKPGSLTALVGPNGAGKSTLLHLLQGRLQRDSGYVECNSSITVMPQRASIDWTFPITVNEMVRLGRSHHQHQPGEQMAKQLLMRVGMEQFAQRRLSDLSGGQQQRVLLARALMQQTGVLLLDEPCSAIDPPTREHLLSVMREQANAGQTLLVSSHDWGTALDSYDKVIVLDNKLLAHGTPSEVREKLSDMTCMMGSHCCG